jgi:DNA-binding CsgD family transcriptional regulator
VSFARSPPALMKTHLSRVYAKLGVKSRVELTATYRRRDE